MIWLAEKKVFQLVFDLGFESVKIPVRVKFEFEVKEGKLVSDPLTKTILYNRQLLERRYPSLDHASFQRSIEKKVEDEIQKYLQEHGFIAEEKWESNTIIKSLGLFLVGDKDCIQNLSQIIREQHSAVI